MPKIFVVANWKSNPATLNEAVRLFDAAEKNFEDAGGSQNIEVIICAPHVFIQDLVSKKRNVFVGAQDSFWEQKGPFTGEISPSMLKSINCGYVILGHSERRRYFNETDEEINKKLKAALSAGLKPILCIGEKEDEKEQIKSILDSQLEGCLKDIKQSQISNIIFVYEPVWAISTSGDQFCSPDYAFSASLLMRKFLMDHYGKYAGKKVSIIYGGSVDAKERDAVIYIKEAKMDGVLVGAASLKPDEFGKIIKSVANL